LPLQVDSDGIEGGDYFSLSAAASLTLTFVVNFQVGLLSSSALADTDTLQ
jgi:hypothetical protein